MSMRHARPLLLTTAVALLAVACDRGGDKPEASPTPEVTSTAVATASATAPPATPTPLPGSVEVGTSGYRVPQHDKWVVNVQSGATTRLQAGLVHCGGCDARYGPRWSPSSRLVLSDG